MKGTDSIDSGVYYPPSTAMGINQKKKQDERRKDVGKRRRKGANSPKNNGNDAKDNKKSSGRRPPATSTVGRRTPTIMPPLNEDSVCSPSSASPNKYSPPTRTKRAVGIPSPAGDPIFLDTLVSRVDQEGTDKYRTMISEQVDDLGHVVTEQAVPEPVMPEPAIPKQVGGRPDELDFVISSSDADCAQSTYATTTASAAFSTNGETESYAGTETYATLEDAFNDEEYDGATQTTGYTSASNLSEGMTDSSSVESHQNYRGSRKAPPVPMHRMRSPDKADRLLTPEEVHLWAEASDYYNVKQKFAYLSICIGAVQLLILVLQLLLCGVAPLDVNPMVGPFPDAFSEWGGKNSYLMRDENEWWRIITPGFLHVGILHLAVNAWIQLDTCAFFEREWGSLKWVIIWAVSEVGCNLTSCVTDPEEIAVGSSGAIMGLFGAKLSQVLGDTMFDTGDHSNFQLEQLSGVLCSLSVVLCLSFFTYIDWSGHMGGLGTGFCVGMVLFAGRMKNPCVKWIWRIIGVALLGCGWYFLIMFLFDTETDADLADPCEYFRNLFSEDHACNCLLG